MKLLVSLLLAAVAPAQTFPGGVYTPLVAGDNLQTKLNSAMTATDNTAVVASTTGWTANMVAYICETTAGTPPLCTSFESMLVTGVSGSNILQVTRGYGGTTAKSHAANKLVQNAYTSVYSNSAQNELQAIEKFGGSGRYVDLRFYGAVCDGTTNVQPAVSAATAAGYTHLFLPKNCFWNPSSNAIPAGLDIAGEDQTTSKIWPTSPTTTDMTLGAGSILRNVNVNGSVCPNRNLNNGCPVGYYSNSNQSAQPVQTYPGVAVSMDVGSTASTLQANDTAGIIVTQRGNGGGIYGQYLGGVGGSGGAAIHAFQGMDSSCTGCAGLRSTKANTGTGFILDEGSLGATGLPDMQFTTSVKTAGSFIDIYQASVPYSGTMMHANLGSGGGSYTGFFQQWQVNTVTQHFVDQSGNEYHAGYEAMKVGAAVASASAITPSGPLFHITGTAAIATFNIPAGMNSYGHCLQVIPDGAFTTILGGNIAVATTAVVNKTMRFCYDTGTSKYYPSY